MYIFKNLILTIFLITLTACSDNLINVIAPSHLTNQQLEISKSIAEPSQSDISKLEVAVLLPLSGEHAAIGQNMLQAIELACLELKVDNIKITPVDTGSNIIDSSQIEQNLDVKKYNLIIGPLFSHHTKMVYNEASFYNIPMISFSNDISLLNNKGLFLIGLMPGDIIQKELDYAQLKGYNYFLALLPENKYGTYIEGELQNKYHTNLLDIVKYSPNSSLSPSAQTAIKAVMLKAYHMQNKTLALLVPEGGSLAQSFIQEINEWAKLNQIQFQLLGSSQWDDENFINSTSLNKAWLASTPHEHILKFEQRFYDYYKTRPFKLTALAYDAVALAATVAAKQDIVAALLNTNGFLGISGIFKFREDGSNFRNLSMFEINDGKLTEIH